MPVEAISCPKCGSAEVTEFKAGSYVCAHCEATFKHVPPAGAAVVCEIDGCGVLAVGRCRSCRRAFCATHGADRNLCSACHAVDRADQLSRDWHEHRLAIQERVDEVNSTRQRLQSISDPGEQLVAAVYFLGQTGSSVVGLRSGQAVDLWNEVCPKWPAKLNQQFDWDPPWDRSAAEVVARWFASRADRLGLRAPDNFTVYPGRKRRGKWEYETVPAWEFRGEGTQGHLVYVLQGGQLKPEPEETHRQGVWWMKPSNLSGSALTRMGAHVGWGDDAASDSMINAAGRWATRGRIVGSSWVH